MSTKRPGWKSVHPVTGLTEKTPGAFGVACMFHDDNANIDFVIMARDKATLTKIAQRVLPGEQFDAHLYYPVTMVQSSMVVLEDDEL